MTTDFSEVPKYYYDRQMIARNALEVASIPIEKATIVKYHLRNPHRLGTAAVYHRTESQLQYSIVILDEEYQKIRAVHQKLAGMTADRPAYCDPGSIPRKNGPINWKGLSPEEKSAHLLTSARTGHLKKPSPSPQEPSPYPQEPSPPLQEPAPPPQPPRLILKHTPFKDIMKRTQDIMALQRQREKEKPICATLERHAKSNGCPTAHGKNKLTKIGAKKRAARAALVVEAKARNDKLLCEIEALKTKAASRGMNTSALDINLNDRSIQELERKQLEKVHGPEYASLYFSQEG